MNQTSSFVPSDLSSSDNCNLSKPLLLSSVLDHWPTLDFLEGGGSSSTVSSGHLRGHPGLQVSAGPVFRMAALLHSDVLTVLTANLSRN